MKYVRFGRILFAGFAVLFCTLLVALSVNKIGRTAAVSIVTGLEPVIMIDPGHGGMDGGAVGVDNIVEKNINLNISLYLRDLFTLNGYKVIMTREEDVSIHDPKVTGIKNQKTSDLKNRLKLMQKYESNCIFLSIHQNKFEQSKYHGAQVFYSANNPLSEQLAKTLQAGITADLQPDNTRVCKESGEELFLLYNAKNPAVLIECGFLSNPEEARQLITTEYQQKMAFSIFKATVAYLNAEKGSSESNI